MAPQEYRQLVERMLEDATYRTRVLAQAADATQQDIAHITASGHITDDKPTAQPVYTVQEDPEAWEHIVSALTQTRTALHRIEQITQQSLTQ
jgi:hypothetical protein